MQVYEGFTQTQKQETTPGILIISGLLGIVVLLGVGIWGIMGGLLQEEKEKNREVQEKSMPEFRVRMYEHYVIMHK